MLRLLIKDITVEISQPRQLVAHIRWQGGSCTEVGVQLPPHRADAVRYPAAVVDRVRHLAQSLLDPDRRSTQLGGAAQRIRQTLHRPHDSVDPASP